MKSFPIKTIALFILLIGQAFATVQAQQKTFNYSLTVQGETSSSDYLPFWFYANKHGIMDTHSPGGQAIFTFQKNIRSHNTGFDIGFGTTIVGRLSENSTLFFNQLYGTIAYKALQFKGGRFYETLGTVDPSLSMGSLAISSNATPVPKIKLGIFHYSSVPFTHGYVEFKGEIAHGWLGKNRFIQSPWLHQKSAYLRFGGNFAFRPYVGIVDEATWAGTSATEGRYPHSLQAYFRVLLGNSGTGLNNVNKGDRIYKLGDHRGIWDFGFYLDLGHYHFTAYRQQIWNDKNGLKFRTPDGLTGFSLAMPEKGPQYVQKVVLEFLYTKNQRGPLGPSPGRGGAGGRLNYYDNYLYRTGWTYKGRNIGNPLFVNAYNPRLRGIVVTANQYLNYKNPVGVVNNRIVAQHIGFRGQLSSVVGYKILVTHSKNYGTFYGNDLFKKKGIKTAFYPNPPGEWSFLSKFKFQPLNNAYHNLQFNISFAGDFGDLYKNTLGVMIGIKLGGVSKF
jgi:hypothetical protein